MSGEVFNFAILRKIAKLKITKYCDIAICVCDQYQSSKTRQYILETDSPNLMLAKISRYMQGFFQGGSIRPPLEAGCPPLRGPPFTYSIITFDIVHVESFPLLMETAVLS